MLDPSTHTHAHAHAHMHTRTLATHTIHTHTHTLTQSQAQLMYTAILNDKPSDEAVVATASNNIITLRQKGEKIFDSLKRSERAAKVPAAKLSARQNRAIQLNRSLLRLHGKKGEQGLAEVAALQQEFPGSEFPVLVHAMMFKDRNPNLNLHYAVQELEPYLLP